MKGVKTITGKIYPKVGETNFYEVTEFHKGTVVIDPNTIKWKLYQYKDHKWDELAGPVKTGKKVTFNFPQKWYTKELLIEAYIFEAEGKAPPGIIVKPCMGDRKINNTEILNAEGGKITQMPKYGQSITLRATTENMLGEVLKLSLWERDTYSDKGHDPKGNQLLWSGNSKRVNNKGFGEQKIMLSPAMMQLANKSMFEGKTHEYYLLVEADKRQTISQTTFVSSEIVLSKNAPKPKPDTKAQPTPKPIQEQVVVKVKDSLGHDTIKVEGISKVVVEVPDEVKKSCFCKDYELIWGSKVSCEFRKKIIEISKRQKVDANNLMSAIAHETGGTFDTTCGTFKKHKDESKEGYVGLIQIGKDAAKSIGTTRTKLLEMSQIEQLDYVEKYITLPQVKGKLNTLTDFYLAILFPVDCGKGNEPNHIVFDNSLTISYKDDGKPIKNLNYWRNVAYNANPAFHKEDKKESGKTYVWEIAENIQIWKDKGEKNKASIFECQKDAPKTAPSVESGTWNVIITEKYTGKKCTHEENTPIRANCRRGKIEIYDNNKKLALTISDCLLEGIAGEDRMLTDSDAPYGNYAISPSPFIMGSTSGQKRTSYGPNPRLSFEPINGSGDEADKSNRSLIRVHGGRQETKKFAPRANPTLLRTHGCIRIFDSDAKAFYDWWVEFHNTNPNIKPGKLKIVK